MVPYDPPLASTRLRRQQPLSGFAGCGRLCATDGDGRGSTARHPTTHGWWLPEYAHARTSKVDLASTPNPWCHPGERRVPVLPTERALDPLFDLSHHADPLATHTHPLHAIVVSISMKLGSALPADRNCSLAEWGSISMRAWSRICILCLKAFASESGSASSRFSSCNPTSSTGSSDSNSFGTLEF